MIARLLSAPTETALAVVALDCLGKLEATELSALVAENLRPELAPERRAAALRAAAAMHRLPEGSGEAVRAALGDAEEYVRVQATHAAVLLAPLEAVRALEANLDDSSWWIRRAAALGLARLGPTGFEALERAAVGDPDPFARDMALLVLQDEGRIQPERARALMERT